MITPWSVQFKTLYINIMYCNMELYKSNITYVKIDMHNKLNHIKCITLSSSLVFKNAKI